MSPPAQSRRCFIDSSPSKGSLRSAARLQLTRVNSVSQSLLLAKFTGVAFQLALVTSEKPNCGDNLSKNCGSRIG